MMNINIEVSKVFYEQTGLKAKIVSQIGFNEWMIETEDGETYHIY